MGPDRALVDELFCAKVEQARAMAPEDKLLAGPRLFDQACRIMADGIRDENPGASEDDVRRILAQRIAIWRKIEGGA
jgi:hypothetical protein